MEPNESKADCKAPASASSRKPPNSAAGNDDLDQRMYTCNEIAERWKMSPLTIRTMFEKEQGVMVKAGPTGKRQTLRIPADVVKRVKRRMTAA